MRSLVQIQPPLLLNPSIEHPSWRKGLGWRVRSFADIVSFVPTPPTILGVDIAGLVGGALGSKAVAATLTKINVGAYNFSNPGNGFARTTTTYTCRAFCTKLKTDIIKGEQTGNTTAEVLILLSTMQSRAIPYVGDSITMKFSDGVTRTMVIGECSDIDPAGATITVKLS